MEKKAFTYAIVGGGMAGLQLAQALLDHKLLDSHKRLAIIEPLPKDKNDKTWCFWEKGDGNWDKLVSNRWELTHFVSSQKSQQFKLQPYSYKKIDSLDFYQALIPKLKASEQIEWITAKVEQIKMAAPHVIELSQGENITAKTVFDSRLTADFQNSNHPWVLQHFKGWVINCQQDQFNPSCFSMMDFSLPYQDQCCFTYVLPFSATKALVEFTFFSPELVEENVYDQLIKAYLEKEGIKNYRIEETEKGVIPMSSYPFHKANKKNYLKIGTAGGWVKASSGYSFKNTEKKVAQLIQNIKHQKPLDFKLHSKRHQWYDDVFLNVLATENHLGNQLFVEMFEKNSIQKVLRFLDEESSFSEEIKLINRFTKAPFLRAVARKVFH
ncbi:MAG: lycopene cyclase family protein [Vicingaceae bacterium]